jgi:hypothetical protein
MAIARGFAAAAILAGLAVGTASAAWADTTMSGHYIATSTNPRNNNSATNDWYVTPCGDGCASVVSNGSPLGQARLVNGHWTMDGLGTGPVRCPDGTIVPHATSSHYTWDQNSLAGTFAVTYSVPACGLPAGTSDTANLQLRQAP